jgi:hypothetical protein
MQQMNEDTTSATGTADPATAATAGAVAVAPQAAAAPEAKVVTPPVAGEAPLVPGAPLEWLADKFKVMAADGTLDEAASARKQAEAYKPLESKLGAGDGPPKTVDEYKLVAPVADAEGKGAIDPEMFNAFVADPLFKGFTDKAHAIGMNNAQLQLVASEYLTIAPELMIQTAKLNAAECIAEVSKLWPEQSAREGAFNGVRQAIEGFGGEAVDMPGGKQRLYDKFGSDPDFIAFAASVSKEMKSDRQPVGITPASRENIEELMKSKPYWDANDPAHAATKAKVDLFYKQQHGYKPR